MASSRPFPYIGMPVRVMHLGVHDAAEVEFVSEDGRELHVDGNAFTLRRLNGKFVRADLPYYGVWLSFNIADGDA